MGETNEEVPIITEPVKSAKCPACGAEIDTEGIAQFTPVSCPACGADFEIPAQFGQFRLLKMLGHGGMGGVFLGRDEMLDRQVAIKVMLKSLGDDPEFTARFQREAQAAARLNHPNIAQIYSFGTEHGQPYIAMELVSNGSLDKKMEREPGSLDPAWTMRVGLQIAQALANAAASSLVHGDVKPENILFDADGNAKLVDFGLAAMQGDSSEIWGTPYYISPEKVKRQKIDFKADIYSLGGTLYHAITGKPPFDGEDATAVVKARLGGVPPAPSEVRPGLPQEIDKILMRMLEEEPARRYPTYDSLIGDINRYLAEAGKGARTHGIGLAGGKKLVLKGGPRRPAPIGLRKTLATQDEAAGDVPPLVEPPKPGMSLGKKAAIVAVSIIGGLAVFGALLTWLLWPKDDSQKILAEARKSVQENIKVVEDGRAKTGDIVANAVEEVEKVEKMYAGCVKGAIKFSPGDAKFLVFPESKELVRVRKELAAAGAAADKPAQQPAAAEKKPEPAKQAKPAARPAPGQEFDPKDPEVQDRLKKEQEEKEKAAKEKPAAEQAKEEAPAAEAAPERAEPSPEMRDMTDRIKRAWDARCSMQAELLKLKAAEKKYKELGEAFDAAAAASVSVEMATMVGEAAAKTSDAEKVLRDACVEAEKAAAKVRGAVKAINKTIKEKTEHREYMRKIDEKAKKEKAEREKRQERLRAEREALGRKEVEEAPKKYEEIKGLLESQSWKLAADQLERSKSEFTTPEGQAALDAVMKKVSYMRDLHAWLIKSAKGVKLRNNPAARQRLKKWKRGQAGDFYVASANERAVTVKFRFLNQRGEMVEENVPGDIEWLKFYKDYKAWLNDLIEVRVVKVHEETIDGRENPFRFKCPPKEHAANLIGAALTYAMYFADNSSAQKRAGDFVKAALKEFPDCQSDVKAIFPEMGLEGGEAPAAGDAAPAGDAAAASAAGGDAAATPAAGALEDDF